MATTELAALCLLLILPHSFALGFLGDIFGDSTPCEDVCSNTFPLHTYDDAFHLSYCRRGCRLYTIISFLEDFNEVNETREACARYDHLYQGGRCALVIDYACEEAYSIPANKDACSVGCTSQVVSSIKNNDMAQQRLWEEPPTLFPMLYVHSLYSNFVDKVQNHISVSWSFYMSNENGQVVIMKSEPHIISEYGDDEPFGEYKTSNYVETNLAALDNAATTHQRAGSRFMDRSEDGQSVDFLGCISKKTGLPRLFLSFTIFVSAMVMIWLCITTAVTAPEHHIKAQPQKLSIYGDLDYLKGVDEKSIMAVVRPQEGTDQAAPLPIKIKVQRI